MEFVFKIRNQDQFSQCLAAISDPSYPEYRHFLNATTLAPFIETITQKMAVTDFLQSQGLTVTDGASPIVLDVSALAGAVQKAFQVTFNFYSDGNGTLFYSADTDPTLPQGVASLIQDITGLENYTIVKPAETPCGEGGEPYCAQAVQTGYDMNPLYSNGFNGTGTTVAVIDAPGDPNPCCQKGSALHTYDSQYGLGPDPNFLFLCESAPTTWVTCGRSFTYSSTWASEAALDIEAVHAMAPGAAIRLFYATIDPLDAIDYVASNSLAQVASNSWTYGTDQSDGQLDPSFVRQADARFAIDAAQGLTVLFASGDEGANPSGAQFGPEYPTSDPNVLGVGATNLYLTGCAQTTCVGYGSEDGASISGGGFSGVFPEPSWQLSTIHAKSGRGVPDVSMFGFSPNFWVYSSYASACGGGSGGGWFPCAGTSLSTPLWAGFLAVAVQLSNGVEFGNIDPLIYQLASSNRYSTDFHDITTGNNGYDAAVGWDPVTGWGTPIGVSLALDLAEHPNFTLTNSGDVLTNQGEAGSTRINVNINVTTSKPVVLACVNGLPPRAFCSFDPSSAVPNYTSTLTISTEPSTPVGVYNITVVATGGIVSNSTSFDLVVNQHQQSCMETSIPSAYNCPLSFVEGWNLFSLPVVPITNVTFPNTVAGIFGSNPQFGFMSNVTTVFTYTNGAWQSCTVTEQGSGANAKFTCAGSLQNLVDGKGYWAYAKAAFTLNNAKNATATRGGLVGSVVPSIASPPSYSLNTGWNLVGYKPQPNASADEMVTAYLQSLTGHYELANVWIFDNTNQVWIRATQDTQLKPSEAMWIFLNTPATLRP